jgi:hypothetical protein
VGLLPLEWLGEGDKKRAEGLPAGSHDPVLVLLPSSLRACGSVEARDAHVPLLRGEMMVTLQVRTWPCCWTFRVQARRWRLWTSPALGVRTF